ncbi:MAG: hypothetical protein AB1611_02605 [bacterium]
MYRRKGKIVSLMLTVFICFGGSLLQARAEIPQTRRDDAQTIQKALHDLLTIFKTYTPCGIDSDHAMQIGKLEERLDRLSREELADVVRAFDVQRFATIVEKLKADIATSESAVQNKPVTSTLDPPNYEFICPPPRRPHSIVLIGFILAIAALEQAENASAILCEVGALIPVEGINTPACVAALFVESVAIVSRATLSIFLTCIASIDSAEIEAGWKNTVHIHNHLAASSEKIDQKFNALEQKLNGIGAQLQKILNNPATAPQGKTP